MSDHRPELELIHQMNTEYFTGNRPYSISPYSSPRGDGELGGFNHLLKTWASRLA
jgi:hypothetical protein